MTPKRWMGAGIALVVALALIGYGADRLATVAPLAPPTPAPAKKAGVVLLPQIDFQISQGDSNVPYAIPVFDERGNAITLPAGTTVQFEYRTQTGYDAGVSAAGLVTGAAPGLATYVFTGADTVTPGTYNARFVITLPIPDGGSTHESFTFPQTRNLRVLVRPPL